MLKIEELCICIVYFNGGSDILDKAKNLSSISKYVVIIDNNSSAGYKDILDNVRKVNDNVFVISNNENMGIAYALNQGLLFASEHGCDLLLTLDQDSSIDFETIHLLAEAIDPGNGVVSVGPYYGEEKADDTKTTDVNYLITSGNIVYVPEINKIGGYNSKLFIDCVDIDFSFNILSHGYKQKKIGGTYLKHKIGEYEYSRLLKIKYKSHAPQRYYYMYRNNIYIYKNYFILFPKQCSKLLLSLMKSFVDIIFIQRNKGAKIKYSLLGFKDGIRNEFKNR